MAPALLLIKAGQEVGVSELDQNAVNANIARTVSGCKTYATQFAAALSVKLRE